MVFQVPVCKILGRETTASCQQMLKYPASSAARSQGPSLLELSHKVTRGLRLADQFLTGAVRPFPRCHVFHTCILAGVRCVGRSSAIRDNDSRWYSDLFDPRTFLDMPLHVLHFDTCVGLTYWFALLEVSHLIDHCCATSPAHGTDSYYLSL